MSQELKSGSLLDHGKYRIEKTLGQGGFGITYLATDLGLNKLRAVKEFFPKDFCDRQEFTNNVSLGTRGSAELVGRLKTKFIKEARNIAMFDSHPGIIRIHSVFEDNNTAYYVMDYVDGQSLHSIVKHSGPLPKNVTLNYIRQIGEALGYIHSNRLMHLDVKPANIMIRRSDNRAILIDFGLSKRYDSAGQQTSTTPTGISHGFAPIEQYRAGGVDSFSPETDIYSLAASLYFLLSGLIPMPATDIAVDGLSFPSNFPSELISPIKSAMSPHKSMRPKTAYAFLQSVLENQVTSPERTLTVTYDGNWMIIDAKIKLLVNDDLVGSFSFKKGFNTKIALTDDNPDITLKTIRKQFHFHPQIPRECTDSNLYLHIKFRRFSEKFEFILKDSYGKIIDSSR